MLGRLVAILTFSRRTDCLTGPAKVIDGDTIVVADQLVRLHRIDGPELDQTFWSRRTADCVRHHVFGRPRDPRSRGQGLLRDHC
jgi:endonuclease YncB( thermonuclease family)